jgi:hypothetical protein
MGKASMNENNNVYFKARKKAAIYNERLYSREGAAELLGVSVSTLADYELGNTKVVPVDKVVLMAEMCNDSQKRQGKSRVLDNRQYDLVQIWYRMEKKAPVRPQIATAPRAKTDTSRTRPSLCTASKPVFAISWHSIYFPTQPHKKVSCLRIGSIGTSHDCCHSYL